MKEAFCFLSGLLAKKEKTMKTMYELGCELGAENVKAVKVLEANLESIIDGFEAAIRVKKAYAHYIKYSLKESISIQNNIAFLKEGLKTSFLKASRNFLKGSIESTMKGMVTENNNG